MEVLKNETFNKKIKTGIALGNFDGLHLGHMSLLNTLKSHCKLSELSSVVYTFDKHPEHVLNKYQIPLLISQDNKINLLRKAGIDYLYFENFDERFSHVTPEGFVKDVLIDTLYVKLVVAGFNYRFGFKGKGDSKLLLELGAEYDINVIIVPPVKINGVVVSSTLIRDFIAVGDVKNAAFYLGHSYSINGRVCPGQKLGKTLGFPTANIIPNTKLAIPKNGVYLTKTKIDDSLYSSITNIGTNPTMSKYNDISIETHIINFNECIYDKEIDVYFKEKIRDEKKFLSKDDLAKQVLFDINKAKSMHSAE